MHEQGMIRSLLREVEQLRVAEGAARVTRVEVEVGPLTGAEPLLLQSAFRQLQPHTHAADADFLIQETPLTGRCQACDASFEIVDYRFRCPACDGGIRVESGDQFTLLSLSLEL